MNNILKNKSLTIILFSLIAIICIIFILRIEAIKEILVLIVFSFIIAYTLKPMYSLLIKKGINSKGAALMLIIGVLLCVLLIFIVLIPSIFKEGLSFAESLEEFEEYVASFQMKLRLLRNNKIVYGILNTVYTKLNKYLIKVFDNMIESTANLGENALAFVVVPIITYYFLCDSEYIESKVLLLCPIKARNIIKRINKDIDKILGRYIIGQFMLCLLVGILTFVVLLILKVRFPLILSILNGAFNIIPYFGPIIGMIPAVIVALIESPKLGLYTLLWLYLIQLLEGNIISPKITGDSVSMHPLGVIIILLLGGEIGGFLGMILAVPIGVIIKVIYEDLNYYLF
ncbi:AI-2E family transporter [Clostridium sp.]|jgi:predicted PurR-regulated permease PerM|uniref:AI-2E family transporter n=1 Tax=Clostridium sp. TaxID=1506 RepID=UPI0039F4D2E7